MGVDLVDADSRIGINRDACKKKSFSEMFVMEETDVVENRFDTDPCTGQPLDYSTRRHLNLVLGTIDVVRELREQKEYTAELEHRLLSVEQLAVAHNGELAELRGALRTTRDELARVELDVMNIDKIVLCGKCRTPLVPGTKFTVDPDSLIMCKSCAKDAGCW